MIIGSHDHGRYLSRHAVAVIVLLALVVLGIYAARMLYIRFKVDSHVTGGDMYTTPKNTNVPR
jgi:hypothetical protein